MSTLTATIGGTSVSILAGSLQIPRVLGTRSVASFTVNDSAGAFHMTSGMPVTLTDSVYGLLYTGYVDTPTENNLDPTAFNQVPVTCSDRRRITDKRRITVDYTGRAAGDIATDFLSRYLAAEGVVASYAQRYDHDSASFGAGTLTNTTAAPGDLELAAAGTIFTKTETTTADFNTGTNVGTVGANNSLQLISTQALRHIGSASAALGSNLFSYVQIWSGALNVAANDFVTYALWVSSTSPTCTGGIDLVCTDGTTLRDSGALDQHQMPAHPKTDLQGYASDRWYTRTITMPASFVGKTIAYATIVQEGDANGTYTIYVKKCTYYNQNQTFSLQFYNGGTPNSNVQLGNAGYYNVSVTPVFTYETNGTRTSPAYNIAAPGILKASIIGWQQIIPTQPASNATQGNTVAPIVVNASWDGGATWLPVTNHSAIPGMLAGMNLTGKTLQLQEILSVAGPSPELTPSLTECVFTIQPAYAQTKTDVIQTTPAGSFGTGTITNLTPIATGIQIAALLRNWNDGNISSQTLFGSDTVSPPAQSESFGTLGLRVQGTSGDGRSRQDWAGNIWVDFVCEFDFQMPNLGAAQYGLEYHTTNWQNALNSGAYRMDISATTVQFNRGSNNSSGPGTNTLISTTGTPWAPTAGDWYHVKVVVAGNTHTLYINNVLFISATDTTYPGGGYVALRYYNAQGASNRTTTFFDNFGIQGAVFGGSRVHPGLNLNSVGTVGNSYISWSALVPSNTTLLIEASLNGGSTWATCTSGQSIPGLSSGTNVSGKTLTLRETLSTGNANATPLLTGITALVTGAYASNGTRASPATALTNVGRVGSASVTWSANVPTGTTLGVDVSPDGSTWTDISALNGLPIPSSILFAQPAPFIDGFTANDAGNYTSTFASGGSAGTWTFDTANNRLVQTGGTNAIYTNNNQTRADMYIEAAVNYSAGAGLIARMVDSSHYYQLQINDGANGNTVKLFKNVGGTVTQLGATTSISFPQGDYHLFRLSTIGTTISVLQDGASILSVTDSSVTAAGKCGLFGGTRGQYYNLRVQALGDTVTAMSLYTRLRLASTLPTATPQVTQLTLAVRSPNIGTGAVIPQTAYAFTKSVGQGLDDLALQSQTYVWYLDDTLNLYMHDRQARPAPYYAWAGVTPGSGNILRDPAPNATRPDMLYRNVEMIQGGVDVTTTLTRQLTTDGITQQWTLQYPFAQAPTLTLNGVALNVGASGATTGADMYWTIGSPLLVNDASETPPGPADVLMISYVGQIPVQVEVDNTGGFPGTTTIAQMQAIDNTSGRVEDFVSIPGITKAAAISKANALLQQYGILGITVTFSTLLMGAYPGMLMGITLPQYGINNLLFLVTGATIVGYPDGAGGIFYKSTIIATTGPVLGDWTTLFSNMLQGAVLAGV